MRKKLFLRIFDDPIINDIHKLYMIHENKHGFPEILSSIDCMERGGKYALIRGTWHHTIFGYEIQFFGASGANNIINVLNQLSISNDIYLQKSYDVFF
uniref:Uncharacterized protein n=1 Tax=Lactuca sativa TaxID=4236 RepID=A0A9R1VP59_LACSA|nr:hypothetical protein LSAT_V11C400203220 [Lactuca sativa]